MVDKRKRRLPGARLVFLMMLCSNGAGLSLLSSDIGLSRDSFCGGGTGKLPPALMISRVQVALTGTAKIQSENMPPATVNLLQSR